MSGVVIMMQGGRLELGLRCLRKVEGVSFNWNLVSEQFKEIRAVWLQ